MRVPDPAAPPGHPPAAIAAALARPFQRIVVFSGAGMSAESGIPTFRSGSNGLWSEFDSKDLATPNAWRRDKDTVWGWYEWRRGLVQRAQPHAGHLAVARLQRERGAQIITQNVDDLHERAGATGVVHLHGSLFAARCFACGEPQALPAPALDVPRQLSPPRCARCGGFVRPGVVWFGEALPVAAVEEAAERIRRCDLLLVVGTSGVVQPAAGLVHLAPADATVLVINPDAQATTGRPGCLCWDTTAGQGLPWLAEALRPA